MSKNNIEENKDKVEENVEKTKKPLSEKIEDTLDDVMGGIQDAYYGEQKDLNSDIPVTIEKPNGIREVNKVQTRRNINKKLFYNKKFLKGLLIFLGVVLGGFLVYNLIFVLLMK